MLAVTFRLINHRVYIAYTYGRDMNVLPVDLFHNVTNYNIIARVELGSQFVQEQYSIIFGLHHY